MNYHIDVQNACTEIIPVDEASLISWAALPLIEQNRPAELTLRLVSVEEITHLNHTYRKQNKATNVLAFPSMIPEAVELDYPLLGDVIICPYFLQTESLELEQSLEAHWAHITIHGVLHLLGYDHIEKEDTELMQALEIKLLAKIGFSNPYPTEDNHIE